MGSKPDLFVTENATDSLGETVNNCLKRKLSDCPND